MTTLAVLGAGVKAVAVAAKAHVLGEMGVEAPDVVAVERTGVGANWQASGGWTDGAQRLGTSPEKDVGFPYRSSLVPRRNARTRRADDPLQLAVISDRDRSVRPVDRPRPAGAHPPAVEPVPALGGRPDRHDSGVRRSRPARRGR